MVKFKNIANIAALSLLAASLVCGASSAYAATDVTKTNDKDRAINNLLKGGWTAEEINSFLNDAQILEYKDAQSIVNTTKYIKLSYSTEEVENIDPTTKKKTKVLKPVEGTDKITELTKEQFDNEVKERKNKDKNNFSFGSNKTSKLVPSNFGLNLNTPLHSVLSNFSYDSGNQNINSSDGYLTYTLSAAYEGGSSYQLSFRFQWVISPYYRTTDVFALGHDGGLTQNSSSGVTYAFNADKNENGTQSIVSSTTPTSLKIDTGGTIATQDLYDDYLIPYYYLQYSNQRGYLSYHANVNSTSLRYVSVYGNYKHEQSSATITPSVSYPIGSLSVSPSSYYVDETPNPYLSLHVNY
ncbi:hypothetical protein PaecuDRAFT_3730 [Paenibacillus curdlanolyticus YK9]|uniref:Uncharacterized protein n=1 Tax=Paenibacillus curdlanolyticus YK9 TaxID=717606 RepID=E0ICW6_9BACL|nr:hypothetical protein [Paenibacillus curdlanolyticus]EFM09681.1 hypothetical protein PaecuDRAFT_3730 [Paenibacillus curdlanolyticus YK9]